MALLRPTASVPRDPSIATTHTKAPVTLPDEEQLREMIVGLLDRRVTVRREFAETALPVAGEVALFDDDDGDLAALALVPAAQVTRAVDERVMGDSLRDNYYEVVNILSSLLNGNPARHVRLTTTHRLGEPVGVDLDALAAARTPRTFTVEIDGFGSGTFHLIEA